MNSSEVPDDIGSKSQEYRIEVFYSSEDQAYIATVPAFDHVSAHGETSAQAVFEVQTILEAVLDIMIKDGAELPRSDLG